MLMYTVAGGQRGHPRQNRVDSRIAYPLNKIEWTGVYSTKSSGPQENEVRQSCDPLDKIDWGGVAYLHLLKVTWMNTAVDTRYIKVYGMGLSMFDAMSMTNSNPILLRHLGY